MYLIDTHAHIYLPEFDADRATMMERAKNAGIKQILLPAIDSSTHPQMLQMEQEFEGCLAMIGLHPCSVNNKFGEEIDILKRYLSQRKFIAIGEIGLDFYWDKTFVQEQYEAFHQQIQIALSYGLPIVIHSRNAIDESIDVVKQYPGLRGVFHCFSGNLEQAEAIIGTGFMLGIGGVLTFKNAGLDKVIEKTGLQNVILETDAPYLAPVPFRGKRNEPAYTALVAEKLAMITGRDLEEVQKITTENAEKLFNLL
ncbi:TatD family hydrolase [Chitinophagaceae bacterium LB-8]|uniref:TatD family hydrolase n=1 Tax=Paraflavisolibacter caeni TaxID=2982496 RepID=A0A9X2XTI1_9BACT|nr:TatD family hydrolase [Paraflavisolibacter caeni]MCU7548726.1 TatD family hydrolase [Paraflavisolibacter caeni]